ncbi:hypothetical protein QJQ45_006523 [Haematococcus lacustris]|nr:hypothetical protein QJQ45_006523 [Haematococcus lacustris]
MTILSSCHYHKASLCKRLAWALSSLQRPTDSCDYDTESVHGMALCAGAKRYSLQGKEHARQRKVLNDKAAACTFASNNAGRSDTEVDLHGLSVAEEYQQGYKRVNDRLPKVRQRLHRAAEYRRGIDALVHVASLEHQALALELLPVLLAAWRGYSMKLAWELSGAPCKATGWLVTLLTPCWANLVLSCVAVVHGAPAQATKGLSFYCRVCCASNHLDPALQAQAMVEQVISSARSQAQGRRQPEPITFIVGQGRHSQVSHSGGNMQNR